jgi:NADPH:quinone reductase-like Zn-dependent oxidoreductase
MNPMKASIYRHFGSVDVLEIDDVPEPVAPDGNVRVRVHAAALNPKDVLVRKGKMTWLTGKKMPRIPGYDFAGQLLDAADGIPAGAEVWGMINDHAAGACAEMIVVPPGELARKPESLSMEKAASIPLAAQTALQALRDELKVKSGDRVLMNGASGGVGTLAVQIGVAMGCEVVGVCSGRNRELVESLGASEVVDYTEQDPRELRGFDHIFDIFGNLSWKTAKPMLTSTGRYCSTVPKLPIVMRTALSKVGLHRASLVIVNSRRADLERLGSWVDAGQLRAVVDRVLPLEEAIEGHRYLETRRARGKVVLSLGA